MSLNSVDTLSNWLFPIEHATCPAKVWFDWEGFLNQLIKHKVPATRCFSWVVPWLDNPAQRAAVIPYAYDKQTKKYDLDTIRDEWRALMTQRVNQLCDNGITPIISLDDHCSRTGVRNWRNHPHKQENNVQGFGPSSADEAAWTGPNGKPDLWLHYVKEMWELYFQIIKPKYRRMVKWELVNEPVNPDFPWRLLKWLQSKGIKREQIWASVTPHNRKRCFYEPGAPKNTWHQPELSDLKRGCSVVSIHQCGAEDETRVYLFGDPAQNADYAKHLNDYREGDYDDYSRHLSPSLIVRADNDGSNLPDGSPLWKNPINYVMVPHGGVKAVEKIRKRVPAAFLLLAGDEPRTRDEWKATWKTAAPFFRVLGA